MERRTALRLIAGGVAAEQLDAAQHHLVTIARAPGAYKLQFFSPAQNEVVDRLAEMIIPADDHSPGAHDARVSLFIDLMVTNSARSIQEGWLAGLTAVDDEARTRFQKPFLKCGAAEQNDILAAMAVNEQRPGTPLEHFFVRLKSMTVDGYYTSQVGLHNDLRYKGNTVLADFPGCTHPGHHT